MASPWRQVAVLYGCGVLAAACLGKFAGILPLLGRDLGLTLTGGAWLSSLIEAGGATLGLAAGLAVGRLGVRGPLVAGLALLAAGGIGQALTAGLAPLFAFRLVEAAGYLAVVVAAPTWIAAAAGARREAALSLWSTFVPVGMALGTLAVAVAVEAAPWRAVVAAGGALAAVAAVAAARLSAAEPPRSGGRIMPATVGRPMWLLAAGFGLYASLQVGLLVLLPSFMVEARGLPAGLAGAIGATASLSNVAGSLLAAAALARGLAPLTQVAVGLVLPAVLLFATFGEGAGWMAGAAAAILANILLGIVPAVAFARLPALAGGLAAAAAGNGLMAQFGASGSLVGPPLVAASVAGWGWPGAAVACAALAAGALALIAAAERGHSRRARQRACEPTG
jgi:MFS family permease